jgi:pyrroline-5-carboxylate reductase
MGQAMIGGILHNGFAEKSQVSCFEVDEEKAQSVSKQMGITCYSDIKALANKSNIIVLAVKPVTIEKVCMDIAQVIKDDTVLISIAAGVRIDQITGYLGNADSKVIRVMPNTPLLAGEGASAVSASSAVNEEEMKYVMSMLGASGKCVIVNESLMDAVTALSGSGPAYFFEMTHQMIEAGIKNGLPDNIARELAVQTCIGAGALLKETGKSPDALRNQVTSPGGTTERGLRVMKENGFGILIEKTVTAAKERSVEMSQ